MGVAASAGASAADLLSDACHRRQNAPGVFTEVATLPRNTCETTRQIRQELTTYILNIYIDIHVCIKIWCNWDFDTAETHDSSPLNIKPTIMDKKIYQDHLSMT